MQGKAVLLPVLYHGPGMMTRTACTGGPHISDQGEPGERAKMDIKEIKERYTGAILDELTVKDGSGRGYICPICGSGSGPKGTGLVPVPGKPGYFKCFNIGCEFYGDILELIGKTYNLAEKGQQIKKAGELLHMDFTDDKTPWYNQPTIKETDWDDDKKTVENNHVSQGTDAEEMGQQEYETALAEMQDFVGTATSNLMNSQQGKDYLAGRGISMTLAEQYRLGYVPNYGEGMNSPALIIPTGPLSFTARSITLNDAGHKVRKHKKGKRAGIFGLDVLDTKPPVVYIVEGELDALSVMEAGFPAIATGGGTSKREIVEAIKKKECFDTAFIVIPDNDRNTDGSPDLTKGVQAGKDLQAELKQAGIRAGLVDVLGERWPQEHKDCNDFLKADKKAFTSFLAGIKLAIEERVLGRVSGYMQDFVKQIAGNPPPIPTHFLQLDNILEGGLHPGLITLGAISSLGKTTFCLNLADAMAEAGQDVIIYSLEMSKFELISKIISRGTAVQCLTNDLPLTNAKTNLGVSDFNRWANYNQEEKELLQQAMNNFSLKGAQHLYIKEGMQTIGTDAIRRDVSMHIFMTGQRPVVIVDYVQILKTPDVRLTDKQKTDENVVELKRISRDYNVPVIAISSFNRENYISPVNMTAYKESGALEYTSDVLIGLQYEGMDYMDGETDKKRTERIRQLFKENKMLARKGQAVSIQCKVLKNRSGGQGDCFFYYFPMFNLYTEETPTADHEESPW